MDAIDEVKPDIKPDIHEKLTIIVSHEGREIKIAVKASHTMDKIFRAAGKAFGMDSNTLKFTYLDKRLRGNDTPEELGMEDGDEISAFLEQVGGGRSS